MNLASIRTWTACQFACVVALCLAVVAPPCGAAEKTVPDNELIGLKILYIGHPGSEREQDFVAFLRDHFKGVATADLGRFAESDVEGHDVAIMDYDGDGFDAPRPTVSRTYSRATVTVGVVGAFICGQQRLKSGYL